MKASNVSSVVWPWRDLPVPVDPKVVAARRRLRALLEFAVMTAVGLLFLLRFDKYILGSVVLTLAAVVLTGGLVAPPLYAGFKRFGVAVAKWAALGMTWLLLVPFYYVFFTVGRVAILLKGGDPLHTRFDPALSSYWVPHAPPPPPERYRKQY